MRTIVRTYTQKNTHQISFPQRTWIAPPQQNDKHLEIFPTDFLHRLTLRKIGIPLFLLMIMTCQYENLWSHKISIHFCHCTSMTWKPVSCPTMHYPKCSQVKMKQTCWTFLFPWGYLLTNSNANFVVVQWSESKMARIGSGVALGGLMVWSATGESFLFEKAHFLAIRNFRCRTFSG